MKSSWMTTVMLSALALSILPRLVAADTGSYKFDVRNMTQEMCQETLPRPIEYVEGRGDECEAAYQNCVTTLSDLAAQTADLKKFYKNENYVYSSPLAQYYAFTEEFRKFHFYMKMTSYTDPSGTATPEVAMTTSFEMTYQELKSATIKACTLTPIFPVDPCGNGVKDPGEFCDEGQATNGKPGKCPEDCRMPVMKPFPWMIPLQMDPGAAKKAF